MSAKQNADNRHHPVPNRKLVHLNHAEQLGVGGHVKGSDHCRIDGQHVRFYNQAALRRAQWATAPISKKDANIAEVAGDSGTEEIWMLSN